MALILVYHEATLVGSTWGTLWLSTLRGRIEGDRANAFRVGRKRGRKTEKKRERERERILPPSPSFGVVDSLR